MMITEFNTYVIITIVYKHIILSVISKLEPIIFWYLVTLATDTRHRYIRRRDPLGNYLWVPPRDTIFLMPDRQCPLVFV